MSKFLTTLTATAIVSAGFIVAIASGAMAQNQRPDMDEGGMTQFICSGDAGWRLGIGMGFMAAKLNLSETQMVGFESFKSVALDAQSSTPEDCATLVEPEFTVFYDSLTDEQKLNLPEQQSDETPDAG